jgi:hypothetical protein
MSKRTPSDDALTAVLNVICFVFGFWFAYMTIGCGHAKPAAKTVQEPIEVKIVEMPAKQMCWISELPEPPEEIRLEHEKPDVIGRSFVHVRQMNDLLAWVHDLNTCLSGSHPRSA